MFTCDGLEVQWLVNGSENLPPQATATRLTIVSQLEFKNVPEDFNESSIQCIVGGNHTHLEAQLLIQGLFV